jgi:predicted esterase YcpF (UPF0227 family)
MKISLKSTKTKKNLKGSKPVIRKTGEPRFNAIYVHGYNSSFKPKGNKLSVLAHRFNVYGVTIDYNTTPFPEVFRQISQCLDDHDADVILGTSFGGFLSRIIGAKYGLPFVAINPVTDCIGVMTKYGAEEQCIESYKAMLRESGEVQGFGEILLDEGDEIIDSKATRELYKDQYDVIMFPGGNHRFAHMEESLDLIQSLVIHFISSGDLDPD